MRALGDDAFNVEIVKHIVGQTKQDLKIQEDEYIESLDKELLLNSYSPVWKKWNIGGTATRATAQSLVTPATHEALAKAEYMRQYRAEYYLAHRKQAASEKVQCPLCDKYYCRSSIRNHVLLIHKA